MNERLPALALFGQGAPIYVQLSTLFRRFIVTGQWPLERQIPTHETLAAQFEVNPATVRRAIALLAQEVLVTRSRRRGTFVIARPAASQPCTIPTTWRQALQAHADLAAEVLESARVKVVPAPFHGGDAAREGYRRTRVLYRRDGRPVALEESHAVLHASARARQGPALRRLARRARRAQQTIRFGIADRDVARLLEMPLNAPVAIAHLSAHSAAALVFESVAWYRGDTVRIAEAIRFGDR